ncbi:hypothetical protein V8E55_008649 [Tylopilus felleus]
MRILILIVLAGWAVLVLVVWGGCSPYVPPLSLLSLSQDAWGLVARPRAMVIIVWGKRLLFSSSSSSLRGTQHWWHGLALLVVVTWGMGDAVEGQWWWFCSMVCRMPHRPRPRWVAKGENSGGGVQIFNIM